MKRLLLLAGILVLAGCANNNPRMTDQPHYSQDGTKSFSQETQQKTGRQTPGEALSQEDASVSVSNH